MVGKAKSTATAVSKKPVKKAAPKKAAPKKAASQKASPAKRNSLTEFTLQASGVNQVFLAGDFNDWQAGAKDFQMRKFKGDIWKKKVDLKPGTYEYQFVVDGNWWTDPENQNKVRNAYHTENSVITVE